VVEVVGAVEGVVNGLTPFDVVLADEAEVVVESTVD